MRGGGGVKGSAVLLQGGSGVVAAGGSCCIAGDGGLTALEVTLDSAVTVQDWFIAPYAGTLRNLFGRINAALGVGITVAATVRVNQANTAITFQFSGAAQTSGNDVTNSAVVAAGDTIAVGLTRIAGVPPSTRFNFALELVRS